MKDIYTLMQALDVAHFELSEAFKELADENVWKRPHPKLLSVGALAAHIAFWEGKSFFTDGVASPLTADSDRYYSVAVDEPRTGTMGAEAAFAEVQRAQQIGMHHWLVVKRVESLQ